MVFLKKITILILLAILLMPLTSIAAHSTESRAGYRWTIMVYLDADNNLESAGISDFNEMEMAGSTDEVAIIVLMDRHPGYDTSNDNWTGARIYLVLHDEDPNEIHSEMLLDLGEVNMGDPETAVSFIEYTVTNFPAEHYAIIFWDHGDAWRRQGLKPPLRGVCWDDTDGYDYITETELVWLFSQADSMGIRFDIIGFDVCLLQMIEVEYDLFEFADIMVASEEFEPVDGWAYDKFLIPLITNPDLTPAELAGEIVKGYGDYYTNVVPIPWATLSAVDLVKLQNIVVALDSMARMLTFSVYFYPENASTISSIREASEKFCEGEFIDLYHFAALLNATEGWVYDPRPYAQELMVAIEDALIANFAGSAHPNATAMAIYFPPTVDWYLEERYWYFEQTTLPLETWWGWFLDFYFRTTKPAEELVVKISSPSMILPGQEATSIILVEYGNAKINPDSMTITLYYPNNTAVYLLPEKMVPGVYKVTYSVPEPMQSTSLMFVVDVEYWFLSKSDISTIYVSNEIAGTYSTLMEVLSKLEELRDIVNGSMAKIENNTVVILSKIGELKASVEQLDLKIDNITGNLAVVNSILGDIILSLDDIKNLLTVHNATLTGIEGNIATISTDVGEIKADMDVLKPKIMSIDGNIITLNTTLGTIKADMDSIGTNVNLITGDLAAVAGDVGTIETNTSDISERLASIESLQYVNIGLATLVLIIFGTIIVMAMRRK